MKLKINLNCLPYLIRKHPFVRFPLSHNSTLIFIDFLQYLRLRHTQNEIMSQSQHFNSIAVQSQHRGHVDLPHELLQLREESLERRHVRLSLPISKFHSDVDFVLMLKTFIGISLWQLRFILKEVHCFKI